jgi:hypothetical protein
MVKTKTIHPELTDAEITRATGRGERTRKAGLLATSARFDRVTRRVVIELSNGYAMSVPIISLPELRVASDSQLAQVDVLGAGGILHWDALDADYSIPALILGAIGKGTAARELARIAGSATSEAKAAAARANGAKGGRPRKSASPHVWVVPRNASSRTTTLSAEDGSKVSISAGATGRFEDATLRRPKKRR